MQDEVITDGVMKVSEGSNAITEVIVHARYVAMDRRCEVITS